MGSCNLPPLSYQQAEGYAAQAGFTGNALVTILAIAQAESSLNPCAIHFNSDGTIDRGILQINNIFHSEVSDVCALDPSCAFQQAYRISNGGQSFTQWATFTNGKYRQYLFNIVPSTTSGHSTSIGTISQIFQQRGVYQWWNHVTNSWNGQSELGTDYGMGGFYIPVGSITSGIVVSVTSNNNSIGYIVQIKSSDGLYWYQHLASTTLHVSDVVNVGDTVGLGGGCPPGSYGQNPYCTSYDQYSTGQHIEVRWSPSGIAGNWVDPQQHFLSIAGGTPQGSFFGSSGQTGLLSFSSSFTLPKATLAPNADVIQVFIALDQILAFVNPFNVTPVQDQINFPGGSFSFDDPVAYVGEVAANMATDFFSFVLRAGLIIGGFFIIYKVASAFIDFSAIGANAQMLGGAALGLL